MSKISHDSETPAQGQQVITACAFIYAIFNNELKVFLAKRAATKKFLPNILEMPGGHIDWGEEIDLGLKREIKEELGMSVSLGDPFAAFTYKNLVKGSHSIEVIYFAKFTGPLENIVLNPEDHSAFVWLSKEDVINKRSELTAVDNIDYDQEHQEDPEYLAILKGFNILGGSKLNLG